MSSEALVTEPLLDKMMISEHPVIIQIKTLLSEAKQVAAVAKAALKRGFELRTKKRRKNQPSAQHRTGSKPTAQ